MQLKKALNVSNANQRIQCVLYPQRKVFNLKVQDFMKPITKASNIWFEFVYCETSYDIFIYSRLFGKYRKAYLFELIVADMLNLRSILFLDDLELLCHEYKDSTIFYSGHSGKILEVFRIKRINHAT